MTEPPFEQIRQVEKLWLLLDYDGTLADFAPTPALAEPNAGVIALLQKLVKRPSTRVSIISGRHLRQLQQLIPVPGVLLAGTYGIEFQIWDGTTVNQLDYARIRPVIKNLKGRWGKLLDGREGFYLEDKGWALAIHARYAKAEEADLVMGQAEKMARDPWPGDAFQLIIGNRFFEIASSLVDKGQTIHYLIEKFPWPGAFYLYLGDDARDEKAFEQVIGLGGLCIKVGEPDPKSHTPYRLPTPAQARQWLGRLVE